MGGRKTSKRKPAAKKTLPKLDTEFPCPFCSNEKAVSCVIRRKDHYATLKCMYCNEPWETEINDLTAPIDVYGDWIEACLNAQSSEARAGGRRSMDRNRPLQAGVVRPLSSSTAAASARSERPAKRAAEGHSDDDEDEEDDDRESRPRGSLVDSAKRPRAAMDYGLDLSEDDDDA